MMLTKETERLVLEITSHAPDGAVTHRSLETFPATLGRAYHNDIILGDPHVSAAHITIDRAEDGFVVTDLGSENGLQLNNKVLQKSGTVRVASGDILRIGHTEIRVFSPQHPVPAAQKIQRASAFLMMLSRSVVVWPLLLISVALLTGWAYLQIWTEDIGQALSVTAAVGLLATFLWSALWAVAGRLVRHKARFRSHVSLFSLAIIVSLVCYYIEQYVDFLSNQNWFGTIFSYVLDAAFLAWLLSASLALATDMTVRKRRLASVFFAGGVMSAIFILGVLGMHSFNQAPVYASQLEPYLSGLAVADTPASFMKDNDALFSSDTFSAKPEDDN